MPRIASLLLLPFSLSMAACAPSSTPPVDQGKVTAAPIPVATQAPTSDTAATPANGGSAPASAEADTPAARDAVVAAMRKFATLKRYRATMTTMDRPGAKATTSTLDYVAPDRFRMEMPGVGTQVVIGETMYMQARGRTTKVPLPAGTVSGWRDPVNLAGAMDGLVAREVKRGLVHGQPSRMYLVRQGGPAASELQLWIGPTGLPIKIETSGGAEGKSGQVSIRYSRYDDPELEIEAPK